MFEAYIRGVWLHQCASDVELKKFETETLDRTFASLLTSIESLDSFGIGVLSAVKTRSWAAMNSYAHTGFAQVVRRNTEGTIEPNYDEGELLEVIAFSNRFAIMAAIEIAHVVMNNTLADELLDKAKTLSRLDSNPGVHVDA